MGGGEGGFEGVLTSGAGVWVEARVTILDVRWRFGCAGALMDTESPDDDPSPLRPPESSSSLPASSK